METPDFLRSTPKQSIQHVSTLGEVAQVAHGAKPVVINMIPRAERGKYNYWRGASVGAAVYNLMQHDMLNTASSSEEPRMHFAEGPAGYNYARVVADSIAKGEGYKDIQYPAAMRQQLGGLAIADAGLLFALSPEYNDFYLRESDRGAREGVIWDGAVTLDMIDTKSRAALEAILNEIQ